MQTKKRTKPRPVVKWKGKGLSGLGKTKSNQLPDTSCIPWFRANSKARKDA